MWKKLGANSYQKVLEVTFSYQNVTHYTYGKSTCTPTFLFVKGAKLCVLLFFLQKPLIAQIAGHGVYVSLRPLVGILHLKLRVRILATDAMNFHDMWIVDV